MTKAVVPARPEGTARAAEVVVQQDLAERTLLKLFDISETPGVLDSDCKEQALALLREAFREAHCDVTLHNVHWWDLGGNSRMMADGGFTIPSKELPPVGTILSWEGKTYYIASHKAPE